MIARRTGTVLVGVALLLGACAGPGSGSEPASSDGTAMPRLALSDGGYQPPEYTRLPLAAMAPPTELSLFRAPGEAGSDALGVAVLPPSGDGSPPSEEATDLARSTVGDLDVVSRAQSDGALLAVLSRTATWSELEVIVEGIRWSPSKGLDTGRVLDGMERVGPGRVHAPFMGVEANLVTGAPGYALLARPRTGDPGTSVLVAVQRSEPGLDSALAWWMGPGRSVDVGRGRRAKLYRPERTPPKTAGGGSLEVSFVVWSEGPWQVVVDCRIEASAPCVQLARRVQPISEEAFERLRTNEPGG